MKWISGTAIALGMATAGLAATSELRLTAQRIEGPRRVCIYGTSKDASTKRIGLGEPCPQRYRAPESKPEPIPALALRVGQTRANGQAICLYRYAGRDYRTVRPESMSCPLTPTGAMQSLTHTDKDDRYRR